MESAASTVLGFLSGSIGHFSSSSSLARARWIAPGLVGVSVDFIFMARVPFTLTSWAGSNEVLWISHAPASRGRCSSDDVWQALIYCTVSLSDGPKSLLFEKKNSIISLFT